MYVTDKLLKLHTNLVSNSTPLMDVIGANQFNELISTSNKLIIVDFWAEWCGPCRIIKPELEKLAEKYGDRVQLVKINVDEQDNYPLAVQYQVNSIPQVTFFQNGVQVDQFIGVVPPARIEEIINQHATAPAAATNESNNEAAGMKEIDPVT